MLRVKTAVRPSSIHGLGLFAVEPIQAGTVTWLFDPDFDPTFSMEQVNLLPEIGKVKFWTWAYLDTALMRLVLPIDDLRYINHSSSDFNIRSTPSHDVAARLILPDEELLCDYSHFETGYFERRGFERASWK